MPAGVYNEILSDFFFRITAELSYGIILQEIPKELIQQFVRNSSNSFVKKKIKVFGVDIIQYFLL